jgi:hypothetical protein
MRSRNQDRESDEPHFSREELRSAILFWLFWSAFVLLSAFLIVALLTDWPEFLHSPSYYFK